MELNKCCIINAAWGGWYQQGQKRLVKSLNYHGCAVDLLTWCNEPINDYFDPNCPYTIKAAAFHEARQRGYTNILWLDCSVWAIKSPNAFFNLIEEEGVYMYQSGYNLAQTATDNDLKFAQMRRDYAETLPECASNMVGINLNHEKGLQVYDTFMDANNAGVCSTSRFHDHQSRDKRFLFGRQDQTAFTIAFYKAGFAKMYPQGVYSAYHEDGRTYNDSVVFLLRGL